MGLFWDKLKAVFKKKNIPVMTEQAEMNEFFDEIDNYVARGGTMTFKQSIAVGFGKEYDPRLAHRKGKSQSRNWKRWKNK